MSKSAAGTKKRRPARACRRTRPQAPRRWQQPARAREKPSRTKPQRTKRHARSLCTKPGRRARGDRSPSARWRAQPPPSRADRGIHTATARGGPAPAPHSSACVSPAAFQTRTPPAPSPACRPREGAARQLTPQRARRSAGSSAAAGRGGTRNSPFCAQATPARTSAPSARTTRRCAPVHAHHSLRAPSSPAESSRPPSAENETATTNPARRAPASTPYFVLRSFRPSHRAQLLSGGAGSSVPECPLRRSWRRPARASQTITAVSAPPVATRSPSAEKAMDSTARECPVTGQLARTERQQRPNSPISQQHGASRSCPRTCRSSRRSYTSQIFQLRSKLADARRSPEGESACGGVREREDRRRLRKLPGPWGRRRRSPRNAPTPNGP